MRMRIYKKINKIACVLSFVYLKNVQMRVMSSKCGRIIRTIKDFCIKYEFPFVNF